MANDGFSSQTMFPAPDNSKSCKLKLFWVGLGRVRSTRSISDFKAQPANKAGALALLGLAIQKSLFRSPGPMILFVLAPVCLFYIKSACIAYLPNECW